QEAEPGDWVLPVCGATARCPGGGGRKGPARTRHIPTERVGRAPSLALAGLSPRTRCRWTRCTTSFALGPAEAGIRTIAENLIRLTLSGCLDLAPRQFQVLGIQSGCTAAQGAEGRRGKVVLEGHQHRNHQLVVGLLVGFHEVPEEAKLAEFLFRPMKDTVDDERLMAWAAIEPMTSSRKIGRPQPKEPPIFTPPNSPSGLTHLKRRVGRSCCISARTLILARSESSDKGAGRGQQEIRGEAQRRRENATERSDLERQGGG